MHSWLVNNAEWVTLGAFLFVLLLALGLHMTFTRKGEPRDWKIAVLDFMLAAALSITLAPWLNNLYAERREYDQHKWTLQQDHLRRLRPVLVREADVFSDAERRLAAEAAISAIDADLSRDYAAELEKFWAPDVFSDHLRVHFPEYYARKQQLAANVVAMQQEYGRDLKDIQDRAKPALKERSPEVALSVMRKCLGKSRGITIELTPSGYVYTSATMSNSVGGSLDNPPRPSREHLATFTWFKKFPPNQNLLNSCENIKRTANKLTETSRELREYALRLAEQTWLPKDCEYATPR